MIVLAIIPIVLSLLTKCTRSKICAAVNMVFLFIVGVVLIVIGGLLVVPANGGSDFIDENCELANEGKFDEMNA